MYQHTQQGWTILISLFLAFIVLAGVMLHRDSIVVFSLTTFLLLVLAVIFKSQTIKIDNEYLWWYFGPGFWKKKLLVNSIESAEVVRNQWYYGWGIRNTPQGWLYNVSGLSAVEIKLKDGSSIRLGSDESELLKKAIVSRLT